MILLGVLAAIVFAGANYFAYDWLSKKQKAQELEYRSLRADQAEAKLDLVEADLWTQRQAWIAAHEPPLGNEGDAQAVVLDTGSKGARDNKLEVVSQDFSPVQHGEAGTQVIVNFKVKGSMQDLVKWLITFQNAEQFYAISSLVLRADQDQKSMICTLQISRYFKDK